MENLLCHGKVPWILKVLHGTIKKKWKEKKNAYFKNWSLKGSLGNLKWFFWSNAAKTPAVFWECNIIESLYQRWGRYMSLDSASSSSYSDSISLLVTKIEAEMSPLQTAYGQNYDHMHAGSHRWAAPLLTAQYQRHSHI